MNTDTGTLYQGVEIGQARERGEPIVEVSRRVAEIIEAGQRALNRQERRRAKRGGFTRSRLP